METHPTNNKNALEALDKFWELLRPVRILTTGIRQIMTEEDKEFQEFLNMFDNIPNPEELS